MKELQDFESLTGGPHPTTGGKQVFRVFEPCVKIISEGRRSLQLTVLSPWYVSLQNHDTHNQIKAHALAKTDRYIMFVGSEYFDTYG